MKKICAALALIATMAISSLATATVWTDHSVDNVVLSKYNTTYQHTYDITKDPNGFVPNLDLALPLVSKLTLDFNNLGWFESAVVDVGNALDTFVLGDTTILLGFAIDEINKTGKLNMTLTWVSGSFTLADSYLRVEGLDNSPAPVPEPGTMLLVGAGLLGLAIYGKRRCTTNK